MIIEKDCIVTIEYTLTDDNGKTLDTSKGHAPMAYLHGHGNLITGLENGLAGKSKDEELKITISPEDGYGHYRDDLKGTVSKAELSSIPDIQVGMQLQSKGPEGVQTVTVTAVEGDNVSLDANHPLAGKTLYFDVKVIDIRKATEEELTHGHAHGDGGHHH